MKKLAILLSVLILISCGRSTRRNDPGNALSEDLTTRAWEWQPFLKADSANPILMPNPNTTFFCPVRQEEVSWEVKDVFNPAAVVRNDKVYMLYRAEDNVGKHMGTSRLGLAVSQDGIHFDRFAKPVFYPDNDSLKQYEWEGGCEDPRIVESEDGRYIMTYTSYDGQTARLCIASSHDLNSWDKHGPAFGQARDGKYRDMWSKSGAIVCRIDGSSIIATPVNGKYWMYWGDTDIFLASSVDLLSWIPLENEDGSLMKIFGPRKGYFDSDLVEPGPPAFITQDGIWMIYNSRNHPELGDPSLPEGTYSAGQVLFDREDPGKVISRSEKNFFKPENDYEITGQVGNVCFIEALVPYRDRWFLYYGTADSKIAVAVLLE